MKNYLIKKKDILNIKHIRCPDTIIKIRKKIQKIIKKDIILIISDDETTKHDIPRFCTFMNHILLFKKYKKNKYIYIIQK